MSDQNPIWHDLSSAQQAIWLDCVLQEDCAAYQVGTVMTGRGQIDPDRARRATAAVITDHQALRLRIDAEQPRQRLGPADHAVLPFRMVKLADAAALADHLQACTNKGFALGAGSLFRVEAIQAGPDEWAVLLTGHHLVVDGMAIGRVRDDWALAYGAPADAVYPGPRATCFIDSLSGDAAYAGSSAMAEDLAYWQHRLTNLPQPLFDAVVSDGSRATTRLELSAERYAALAEAARSSGTTVHRALVAITGIAIGRRFGRDDLMIGMALHGRPNDHLETVGQFARILPFRCSFDPAASFAEGVRALAAALDADMKHQRVPLDAIGRALGSNGRDQAHLFEVAVSILPPPALGMPRLGDLTATIQPQSGQEHSPLSVFMREQVDGSLALSFGHDPAKIGGEEIARIADRIEAVIQRLLERPTARINALPALARGEAAQIAAFEAGLSLPLESQLPLKLLRDIVAQDGNAVAVISGPQSWTYQHIDRLSDGFAASFAARGIGKGDVVAVILTRSCDTIAALLGLLKLGAVYLPVDPSQPEARAKAMLESAQAKLVLTQGSWCAALAPQFALMMPDEIDRDAVLPMDTAQVAPGDPAYVIFTSGSTGKPKGVVVPHRAIANLDAARQLHDPVGPGDRVLAAISVGFDVSIGQLLLPLLRGACVVIAPDVRLMGPAQFWGFLAEHGVTHINSVPSFFEAMLEGAPANAQLHRLMLGGEPLSAPLARRLRAELNGTQVVNMYGPTEACIDASAYVVPADLAGNAKSLPIGRPLPNYSFFILDEQGRQVGVGHVGELHIGGIGLALGYLDAPELTSARFIDSDYGRIYRTGDLAAWREDGEALFMGRVDGQVKIRGHRIELGEIEAQLLAWPEVQSAAVIARPDAGGNQRLLGYVVAQGGQSLNEAALRAHVAAALPSYMMPAAITAVERLPLTTNGKLDQRALPEPETGHAVAPARPPETPLERQVAALYCELLAMGSVSADDDFFALGGHSLLATRLVGRLREEMGADVKIKTVYEAPSVAALARAVGEAPRAIQSPPLVAANPRPDHIPLSFAQERLWFLDRLEPASAAYNIPLVFRAEGELDADAMRAALALLIDRHESLRTRFAAPSGEPVQIIEPQVECPFQQHDLSGAAEGAIQQAIMTEALRPFDLEVAPLIRLALFRLGEATQIAVLTVHHIIADGWSMAVLLDELTRFYVAAHTGASIDISALKLHYADYALWQRDLLKGDELDRQHGYWLGSLAGVPDLLDLPRDEDADGSDGDRLQKVIIGRDLGRAISEFAAGNTTSPFSVLMSAWSLLLSKWSGQRDLLVGTALAGRQDSCLDNQIGFYVNTLPVRAMVDPQAQPAALVQQTAARMMDIQAHQDMPFDHLVRALKPARIPGRHPLFQALFVLQNGPAPMMMLEGLSISPVALPAAPARFDLALSLAPDGEGYSGEISFAASQFTPRTAAVLADRYVRLLEQMTHADAPAIGDLPILQGWGRDWSEQPETSSTGLPAIPPTRTTALSPMEREVGQIWQELTGAGSISVDSDFFDLGGHSLAALRLTARLEAMRGHPVPVSLIFSYPKLSAFCAALNAGTDKTRDMRPLVPLQQGDGPPLFCVHPVGGGVFGYVPLARSIAPGREVWGLQARGFDDDAPLAKDIETMALDYVAAVRRVQPKGPYHLLGHSFGGMVAFAMAQLLEAAGDTVAQLVLMDSEYPGGEDIGGASDALLAMVPQDKRALVAQHVRLARASQPQGQVMHLAYLRADGDGRDTMREAQWLAHAQQPKALPPVPCGHYAMLDAEQANTMARHLDEVMLHATFTMLDA